MELRLLKPNMSPSGQGYNSQAILRRIYMSIGIHGKNIFRAAEGTDGLFFRRFGL